MPVHMKVNGKPVQVHAATDEPLLWVLRDTLGLKGTEFGCGVSLCGACTVWVNGTATRSCITPASMLEGADVVTIEGLSPDGSHPVQRAWLELDVPQCGYCQAGQILTAVARLEKNARPTDADIDTAMKGNVCRCGTYLGSQQAIHEAANGGRRP